MGMNITEKLIKNHLVSGEMVAGKEIAIKIDQTRHGTIGRMAYRGLKPLGFPVSKQRNLLPPSMLSEQAEKTQMTINISRR